MTSPQVLLVDDDATAGLLPDDVNAELLRPNDPAFTQKIESWALKADLILLDHNLELEGGLSLLATDGASFVGHLRSWARTKKATLPPVVIYTSEDEAYAEEIPSVGVAVPLSGSFVGEEYRLAPTLDVEWLVWKTSENAKADIRSLANASSELRKIAGQRADLDEVKQFLAPPPGVPWTDVAKAHILRARPPISESEAATQDGARGATAIYRWLLQKALAYPGVFMSDLHAAWTLGITPGGLNKVIDQAGAKPWASALEACVYKGPANSIYGRRWWSAGLEFCAWELRQRFDVDGDRAAAIADLSGAAIPLLSAGSVVTVNLDLREDGFADVAECMQLHPPGWPAEVPEPWMRRDLLANEPTARAMLDPADFDAFAS